MRRTLLAAFAIGGALAAGCFTAVDEVPSVPDAGGCPVGEDCGGGLLPDAGCPIGQVCPACDAGFVLVGGACVSPGDAGPAGPDAGPDAGSPDAGPQDAGPVDAGPPGANCLSGTLTQIQAGTPISGAAIVAVTLSGVPIAGAATTSAGDGAFQLCPPDGVTFTTQITAATYPVTYFESADLMKSEALGNVPMVPINLLGELGTLIPGVISQDAIVLAPVTSLGGNCSPAGWTFAAGLPGGGLVSYKIIYLAASGLPQVGLTATSTTGIAVIYNIDPTMTSQVAITATNPAAGSCASQNATLGFTGQVEVAAGALSVAPIILP